MLVIGCRQARQIKKHAYKANGEGEPEFEVDQ